MLKLLVIWELKVKGSESSACSNGELFMLSLKKDELKISSGDLSISY